MNPKMNWTVDMEAALIDLISEKPYLWDARDQSYVRKSQRNERLQEVAAVLQRRWPDHAQLFTQENMVNKFAVLRSYFCNAEKLSDTGTEDFEPKWEHYVRLNFLENVPLQDSKNRCSDSLSMDLSEHSDDSEVILPDIELDCNGSPGTSSPQSSPAPFPSNDQEIPHRKKLKSWQSSDESSNESANLETTPHQQESAASDTTPWTDSQRKNSLDLAFCRYLNTMLSPIPDCLQKELAKIKITETILKLKYPQA